MSAAPIDGDTLKMARREVYLAMHAYAQAQALFAFDLGTFGSADPGPVEKTRARFLEAAEALLAQQAKAPAPASQ